MLGSRPDLASLAAVRWDAIVVGGGVTGAGVLLEAARRGAKVLLLERRDFAWGASSRSSKMVHGGLRYLAAGDFRLTRDALRERERLLRELPDLVIRQPYAFVLRRGDFPGPLPMKAALWLYDFLAGIRDHQWLGRERLLARIPGLANKGLRGGMIYTDALTDDARLVMRILHEAAAAGGRLTNYVGVESVRREDGHFALSARDEIDGRAVALTAATVIDAAGAATCEVAGEPSRIRPLRGSHLLIRRDRLPIDDCVTALHPKDKRPVFIYPWLGLTCVGTTDLDHGAPPSEEPRCSAEEADYLLDAVRGQFPHVGIAAVDVVSSMAGVRPVIASGKGLRPSQESREHSVWLRDGMVCVAGGKLTTFRLIALDALRAAGVIGEGEHAAGRRMGEPLFRAKVAFPHRLGHPTEALPEGEALIETLRWALDNEMVVRLDDLLLRRVRLGNTRPEGARDLLPKIGALCRDRLGWDEARWAEEAARYLTIVERAYSLPGGGGAA